jgi:hypothetical protein
VKTIAFILVAFSLLATPGGVADAAPDGRRAELRERLRSVRIARLVEALELDAGGAARLGPILDRGYDAIGAVVRQSGAARRELRLLVAAERPDDARINQLIDQLAQNRARIEALTAEMFRSARQVLTPRQVGRLVLALPEIERQLQQQIRRAARAGWRGDPADPLAGDEEP